MMRQYSQQTPHIKYYLYFLIIFSMSSVGAAHPSPHSNATQRFTLDDALARAYSTNPTLQRERAILRQTDETVAQARAGWRPSVTVSSVTNYSQSDYVTYPYGGAFRYDQRFAAPGYGASLNLTQTIFTGGKTRASELKSLDQVGLERATLMQTEQEVFLDVVKAYVNVVQASQLVDLAHENEATLANQVGISSRQLQLNQGTQTDTLQSASQYEVARAASRRAQSDLAVARATLQSLIGVDLPEALALPQPLQLKGWTETQATRLAVNNNPLVVRARYSVAIARDGVGGALAAFMPQVSALGSLQHQVNQNSSKFSQNGFQIMMQASMPLYQGGAEYAALRGARDAVDAATLELVAQRRAVTLQVRTAWNKLQSDRDELIHNREATALALAAVHSIQAQEMIGSRTIFELLQQQQILFQQQKALLQNVATTVEDSYMLVAATGRLNAADLDLATSIYDPVSHFKHVEGKLVGN